METKLNIKLIRRIEMKIRLNLSICFLLIQVSFWPRSKSQKKISTMKKIVQKTIQLMKLITLSLSKKKNKDKKELSNIEYYIYNQKDYYVNKSPKK